jgi:hypothetical protein
MCILSFIDVKWVLVDAKCTMRCRVGTLCDVYSLIVGALPEGYPHIPVQRAFGIKDPVEKRVEQFALLDVLDVPLGQGVEAREQVLPNYRLVNEPVHNAFHK